MEESTSKILGLDIGEKKTGVALSDESGIFSFPHSQFEASNKKIWMDRIAEIVEAQRVSKIVVGLPLNQYGEPGDQAEKVRKFVALCRERLKMPVIEWDERFSTAQAERSLIQADVSRKKRKKVIDKVAAVLILQNYLDAQQFEITDSV